MAAKLSARSSCPTTSALRSDTRRSIRSGNYGGAVLKFFFETLVRVHRAGEGAPFTGLKPAGTEFGPLIEGADKALDNGDIEPVVKLVTGDVVAGIRQRFAEAREKKEHANQNVAAGREFVAAYVEYVHYVEGLHQAAQGASAHHEEAAAKAESAEQQHHH